MEQPVLFDVDGNVATITLNRPDRKNSLNQALLAALYDCLDRVGSDDDIRACIITGSGNSFCSGIDLGCLETDNLLDPRGDGVYLTDAFAGCHKPVIGAVNGYAITGGFELALNCDFLIASENASFKDTHALFGIHPGWGMSQLLQQAVGMRRAKQISLTGAKISAQRALEYGIVNEVVPAEKLPERAMEIAKEICAANNAMMQTVKSLIENRNRMTFDEAMASERKGFAVFAGKMFKTE